MIFAPAGSLRVGHGPTLGGERTLARTLLLVGTRKGCFVLESDEARRDWTMRGPYCEGWPVYHAIYEPSSGAIYAAAASEWHGSAVWRSPDLGETWTLSSEGITYGENGKKLSKVSTLAASPDRVLVGVENPGIFASDDAGATWSHLSSLEGQPGSEGWADPSNQPPGHLGISALMLDGGDTSSVVPLAPGHGRTMPDGHAAVWRTRDAGSSWQQLDDGLPKEDAHIGVLREAMAIDGYDSPGLYFGTSTGQLFASTNEGDSWSEIASYLPSISSVGVAVLD